jgi:hypothetical protein
VYVTTPNIPRGISFKALAIVCALTLQVSAGQPKVLDFQLPSNYHKTLIYQPMTFYRQGISLNLAKLGGLDEVESNGMFPALRFHSASPAVARSSVMRIS